MRKGKISVYRYHDYRKFFEDWMSTNGLTLRQFAKVLDISPSYLSLVISGKKEFSADALSGFKKVFKLDKYEYKHLSELLSLSRSESHHQKIEIFNKIIKDKKYQKNNPNEMEAFSYLSHWYFVALKEYFSINSDIGHFSNLKDNFIFKIKNSEIKKALLFLTKENFIEIDQKNSKVKLLKDQVDCYSDIYRLSLGQFHAQMFTLAIEAINIVPREERLILGNTVGLSAVSYEKVKELINKLHEDIKKIETQDQSKDRVFHIGLSAFPLTKKRTSS